MTKIKVQRETPAKGKPKKEKEEKIVAKTKPAIPTPATISAASDIKGSESYGAKDIYVLEGLDPVRKRPGMYIGSTGVDGLHHLIWEVVDNSIDEAMAGFATHIKVELSKNNRVAVTDNGRGIPVDLHPQTKKTALETVMTTLHAGGKFGGDSYKVSGGLHGVGVSIVNALSTWVRAEVSRDGTVYSQEYSYGKAKGPLKKNGLSHHTGTKIIFDADPEIFPKIEYDLKKILDHLRQQAYLTKNVRIEIVDERSDRTFYYGFCFDEGIKAFTRYLSGNNPTLHDNQFYVEKQMGKINVEASFLYTTELEIEEMSFANNIYNPDGGMHLTGFRTALTRTLNDYAYKENYLKEKEEGLTGEDVREGLIAAISIKLPEPQFEGQTKARLGNPEARPAVDAVVSEALKEFLERYSSDARRIIERNLLAAKARRAAKAAKDTVLRKSAFEGLTLPGKLADCISRRPEESELFIVEGDSAGGSAKSGRDRRTQAILPLKGKILNVEKARIDKMLLNKEIYSLVMALGTAISENFDIGKLRYHKVILMTDADVDGAHIRTLLLTLFYRYFLPIIGGGYVYIAQPPLYKIQFGKTAEHAYSDVEKDKIIKHIQIQAKNTEANINIQRYKGLGEMNPAQLWETTMDPTRRILKQVEIEDAVEADRLFDILMGEVVEPRKNFIQAHAQGVKNLDI